MPFSQGQETALNTISGQVMVKESRVGIPGLVVAISSSASSTSILSSPSSAAVVTMGNQLASAVTRADGSFELIFNGEVPTSTNPPEKLPDLQLSVLAPEEPGVMPQNLVLFSAVLPRERAAIKKEYIIVLATALLQKAGIPVPSEISQDLEPAQNVVGKLNALVARQNTIIDGAVAAAKQLVDAHRTRAATIHQTFMPNLRNALSRLPASSLNLNRIVATGESVFSKSVATIQQGIQETVNSDDPAKRAPRRGFISLTADQVHQLRSQLDPDGTVPASAVAAVAAVNNQNVLTTSVQAIDRLPLCRAATPTVDCTDSILNPSAQPTGSSSSPPTPGTGVTTITNGDVPRYLARLMEPLTAPEEEIVVGLMPVATRDTVQSSVQSFVFEPSPADVPAFHDFNNLQIAFEYVWQEALDQDILDLAQNAYETIVGLGGNPDHPDHQNLHPLRALTAESNLVLKANASPTIIVRDHRGEPPGTRLPPPPPLASPSQDNCPYAADAIVRDHRAGVVDPMTIADPVERLPALIEALNKKLLENYNFTIYAANEKERSVNFGILNTYRQIWTPLSYQAGPLVKSIPLAPKQTQKVVITRKTVKKRSRKEVENHLSVLKEETSQTNRAEQEIANRAMTKTSFSIDHQDGLNVEVSNDSTTMKFSQDAQKNADDIKKSFRESVFKAAQEFKHEKTTEITTEETQEFESVETTEISNPNDEIAVTFLFYELQRRYRLFERLYRVQPVVLVAQEFPQPSDIDQSWLVRHDWILKRVILDDSFLPVLENIAQTAGDEIALEEMKANVNQQRCIVNQLRQELAIASQQTTVQRALIDQAVFRKSGASDSGLFGSIEGAIGDVVGVAGSIVGDVAGAVGKVGEFILGGGSDQNNSNRQAMQDSANEAADKIRDLMFRLEREVTALNALTETYTKALREHNNHLAEIARLEDHVKDNIMRYMQAIWTHEPPDQRFFRLHNTPIPDLTHTSRGFRVDLDHPLATTIAPPHQSLPRFGGRDARVYPVESVANFATQFTYKPLSEVADLDHLLGFKGNYAIFPLYQSNVLTDFMMDPYIDRATGQLVDPSDPLNWSLDEFSEYVCCLKKKLPEDEFQQVLPQLQTIYQAILTNPARNDDVLVVPTNSLFIEALPAAHSLLEKFKLDHRMIDVKKAQAEAREKELENVRRTARILSGERGDPNIDKRILIEGTNNGIVVPAGDQ